MDIHQTEEQQVEAIKKFWDDNGNSIIAGLAIGLAGFVGFNWFKEHKLEQEIATADAYESVIELAGKDNDAFKSKGESFIAENTGSSYSAFTAFALAKDAADNKNWEAAAKHLNAAISNASDNGIKAIATVRLARVQVQLEQFDKALSTLSATLPESFKAQVEEVKGDTYLKQGKPELARNAYQAAIDASGDASNPVLQMKLDDLAESVQL